MKKILLTLAIGLLSLAGQAQRSVNYMEVHNSGSQSRFIIDSISSVVHTGGNTVHVSQSGNTSSFALQSGDEIVFINSIEDVFGEDSTLYKGLKPHMPIYEGSNPPVLDGVYRVNPAELVYDTQGMSAGSTFIDRYIKFSNMSKLNNTVDYYSIEWYNGVSTEEYATESYVQGDGNNFTMYLKVIGTDFGSDYDITFKKAIVVSGTVGANGIENLYRAFVFTDKSADPNGHVVPVGTIRVVKDGNGWSELTTMPSLAAKRIIGKGEGLLKETDSVE